MFSLNMVDYSMSFLSLYTWDFFCWTSRGDHSEPFLLFKVYCGIPPSCLKVGGGVEPESMWWSQSLCGEPESMWRSQSLCGGPWDFSVSPRPLGFGFLGLGLWGLGPGGLTIWRELIAGLMVNRWSWIFWKLKILFSTFQVTKSSALTLD